MLRLPTLLLSLLLAAAALALPSVAAANTLCVNAPDCPAGGVSTGGNLQAALDTAGDLNHSGADTILIGDKGSAYQGPFSYVAGRATDTVTIKPAGPGRPVLSSGVGDTVLALDGGTLDGIDVAMPSPAEGTGIEANNATLHDVTVSSAVGSTGATGVIASGGSTLNNVRITALGDVGLAVHGGPLPEQAASVSAQNLQISGAQVGVDVNANAWFSATQSRIASDTIGLTSKGITNLDRVAVATNSPNSTGIDQSDGNLALEHVTVAHVSASGGGTALSLHATNADRTAAIDSSALAGYTHGLIRTVSGGHTLAITAAHSVWNNGGDQLGPASAGSFHEAGDVHSEPALVNLAGGDLRPRGSSAQIDLDPITDPLSYADLQGNPATDGNGDGSIRPDAGALEYRHLAPTITTLVAPGGGNVGAPVAFNTGVTDPDGDQVQVRWDFGDGTSATGTAVTHAFSAPGSFQAAVTATDEAGLSDRRTFTVAISPGTRTGPTGGGPTGTRTGVPVPPTRGTRLVLRRLRLTPSSTTVERAARVRLHVSANKRATIRIVLAPRSARHTGRARVITRTAKAGANSIALAAALRHLRLLAPGRLALTITATDATGHHTQPRTLLLTLRR